jgi:hypothetical protein
VVLCALAVLIQGVGVRIHGESGYMCISSEYFLDLGVTAERARNGTTNSEIRSQLEYIHLC